MLMFVVNLVSDSQFEITHCKLDGKKIEGRFKGNFNATIHTACGNVTLSRTKHFGKEYVGEEIHFFHTQPNLLADAYLSQLSISLNSKESTVVDLSIKDESPKKAEDILNTLITVYNEQWVQDRNLVAESTSQFISERLAVIEADLGHVDNNISSYKSRNLLPDVQQASNMYMTQALNNQTTLLTLNNQRAMAQFVLNELQQKSSDQTLPSNSGLANVNVENLITEYNSMVLERNRLIANSSKESPVAADMGRSLKNMHQAIYESLNNHIASLNTQIESYRKQERTTTGQLASNPNQAFGGTSAKGEGVALHLFAAETRRKRTVESLCCLQHAHHYTAARQRVPHFAPQAHDFAGGICLGTGCARRTDLSDDDDE